MSVTRRPRWGERACPPLPATHRTSRNGARHHLTCAPLQRRGRSRSTEFLDGRRRGVHAVLVFSVDHAEIGGDFFDQSRGTCHRVPSALPRRWPRRVTWRRSVEWWTTRSRGTGAERQRAVLRRRGRITDVVDLIVREPIRIPRTPYRLQSRFSDELGPARRAKSAMRSVVGAGADPAQASSVIG